MGVGGRPTRASAPETNPPSMVLLPLQSNPPAKPAAVAMSKIALRDDIVIVWLLQVCRVEVRRISTMTLESRLALVAPVGGLNTNVSASAIASVFQSLILSVYCGAPTSVLLVMTYLRGIGRAPASIHICQSVSIPRNARCSHSTPSTTP